MNILFVRTDNIGDLVCTTPLIEATRAACPEAWIGLLANAYSAPAVVGHPALDEVLVYRKAKHLEPGESRWGAYWDRLRTIMALRRRGIDWLLVPSVGGQASARRFAGWIGARQVLINEECDAAHEVEKVFALARRFPPLAAAVPEIPPCRIVAEPSLQALWQQRLATAFGSGKRLRVGLHISARKPSQRWPAGAFVEFARCLAAQREVEFMLFWSPGDEHDPCHPGDDRKAAEIVAAAAGLRLLPAPTAALPELIAGLSLCDLMVQSDGGAMHLAAALGKPIVCFFGQSDAARWQPWGVPHIVLQPASREVAEVSVEAALAACEQLLAGGAR